MCHSPVDLVLALDASDSVDSVNKQKHLNWNKEVEFAKQLINKFVVSETGTHIGVIEFSTYAHTIIDLNSNEGKQISKINEKLESLKRNYSGGSTFTDRALTKAVYMFQNVPASRKVPKLFIILTDGEVQWRENQKDVHHFLDKPLKDLRDLSVKTFSIGVGNAVNDHELLLFANNIPRHRLTIGNFDGLFGMINNLTEVACPSKWHIRSGTLQMSQNLLRNFFLIWKTYS